MTTLEAVEKHLTVNGVQLRYLDWGTDGKTPLVCLHGHTGHARIWDEFAETMSLHYHVLTVDQRGHGESQWASTGYARDRFVEDLAAFVNSLNLSRFVLVGLSMGGWNSLLYTVDHPERVERIVIVDIAPEPSPESTAEREKRPPTPMEFASTDAAVGWARQGNTWASDARLRKDVEDKIHQREDGLWTWRADPALFNYPAPGHDGTGPNRKVLEGPRDNHLPDPGGPGHRKQPGLRRCDPAHAKGGQAVCISGCGRSGSRGDGGQTSGVHTGDALVPGCPSLKGL